MAGKEKSGNDIFKGYLRAIEYLSWRHRPQELENILKELTPDAVSRIDRSTTVDHIKELSEVMVSFSQEMAEPFKQWIQETYLAGRLVDADSNITSLWQHYDALMKIIFANAQVFSQAQSHFADVAAYRSAMQANPRLLDTLKAAVVSVGQSAAQFMDDYNQVQKRIASPVHHQLGKLLTGSVGIHDYQKLRLSAADRIRLMRYPHKLTDEELAELAGIGSSLELLKRHDQINYSTDYDSTPYFVDCLDNCCAALSVQKKYGLTTYSVDKVREAYKEYVKYEADEGIKLIREAQKSPVKVHSEPKPAITPFIRTIAAASAVMGLFSMKQRSLNKYFYKGKDDELRHKVADMVIEKERARVIAETEIEVKMAVAGYMRAVKAGEPDYLIQVQESWNILVPWVLTSFCSDYGGFSDSYDSMPRCLMPVVVAYSVRGVTPEIFEAYKKMGISITLARPKK